MNNKTKEVKAALSRLKKYAKQNGLEIRFVDRHTDTGDFHLFIYDKEVWDSYMVVLDGYWDTSYEPLTFDAIYDAAARWIEFRDFRYTKINGRWEYNGS